VSAPTTDKPSRLEVIAENIPERIRKLRRWIVWSWRLRNGKWDKPPLQLNGDFASVSDPATWTTFEKALAAHQSGQFDGIGFVLGYDEDEGVCFCGADFDDCRNPDTGEIEEWAATHLRRLDTYAEVSPSRQGVKALAIGTLPGPDHNESERLGIEVYSGGRYFTVTGHRLPDVPVEIGERSAELAEFYHVVFGDANKEARSPFVMRVPSDRAVALSALSGLNTSLAVGYGDWLRVGMALHHVADDGEMLASWDCWSRHCTEKYQDGACAAKWKTFGNKGGLGLGSLIYWARQNGWTYSHVDQKQESSAKADASIVDRLGSVIEKGPEALFRDRELLDTLGRLAETDPPEFACVRAKLTNAKISLRDFDRSIAPSRQRLRAQRPPLESAGSYRVVGGRMVHLRTTREGPIDVPLCNFSARITEVVTRDDGVEQTAVFSIEGQLSDGRPLRRLQVPANDFHRLDWVTTGWHGEAVVLAGQGTRDHTRCAIELLSGERARRVQYLHTGWRQVGKQWVFLHAGGAIGKDGAVDGVEVELAGALSRVHLPVPPSGTELVLAVQASLRLLTLARHSITAPVLAEIYRAPLGDVDFSLHHSGQSGVFKTELSALAQSHFGAGFDARSLPGNWSSTENALEELTFCAKDIVLVIDDFKPQGSTYDVQSYHRKADRLFRAIGNHCGRQRMAREGRLRAEHRPRGLVHSTGEEIPNGESLRARLLVQEISDGDIDRGRLTECQRDAAAGKYTAANSGYLRWLASRYSDVRATLKSQRDALRDKARSEVHGHARSPGIIADLALGLKYFFDFAVSIGAMTEEERTSLAKKCWAALLEAGEKQKEHIEAAEPCGHFLRLLAGVLASGRGHVAGPDGKEPADPEAWGWQGKEYTHRVAGDTHAVKTEISYLPKGNRIGWVDGDDLYLEPEAVFAEVQSLARSQGENLSTQSRTLWRRLKDGDYLASWDVARKRTTVRRTLGGVPKREVLHLRRDALTATSPSTPSTVVGGESKTPESAGRSVDGPVDGSTIVGDGPSTVTVHENSPNDATDGVGGRCGRWEEQSMPGPCETTRPRMEEGEL
jgi:hypothetical protein